MCYCRECILLWDPWAMKLIVGITLSPCPIKISDFWRVVRWTEQWRVFVQPDLKSKREAWGWILFKVQGGWVLSLISVELKDCKRLSEFCTTDTLTHIQAQLHQMGFISMLVLIDSHTATHRWAVSRDAKRRDLVKERRSERRLSSHSGKCDELSRFRGVLLSAEPHVLTFTSPRLLKCPFWQSAAWGAGQCSTCRHRRTQSIWLTDWQIIDPTNHSCLVTRPKNIFKSIWSVF